MVDCDQSIRWKCTPLVDASPVFVCEKHMPHWRDKYYTIKPANKVTKK